MLLDGGRVYEALGLLERDGADDRETMIIKGALYIGLKDWPRGWRYFHARHHPDETHHEAILGLTAIIGRRVVLYQEAGLGDTMQFMRWAPLIRQYASDLAVFVRQPLYRLMTHLDIPEGFEVVNWSLQGGVTGRSSLLGVLDAPLIFGHAVDQIPSHKYLRSLPKEARRWRFSVGLGWAAGARDKRKTIGFDHIRLMMDHFPMASFISLQQPDHYVNDPDLIQLIDAGFDLLDTARIINQLDLIITVDTAVAHLAGTLGRPVWLLLCRGACWRWFYDDSTTTPWYPTMRLYRQPVPGDWDSVIALVMSDLDRFIRELD